MASVSAAPPSRKTHRGTQFQRPSTPGAGSLDGTEERALNRILIPTKLLQEFSA